MGMGIYYTVCDKVQVRMHPPPPALVCVRVKSSCRGSVPAKPRFKDRCKWTAARLEVLG